MSCWCRGRQHPAGHAAEAAVATSDPQVPVITLRTGSHQATLLRPHPEVQWL